MPPLGSFIRQMCPALHSRLCSFPWTTASSCLTNETVARKFSCLSQTTPNQGDERSLALNSPGIRIQENPTRTGHLVCQSSGWGMPKQHSTYFSSGADTGSSSNNWTFKRSWATTTILTQCFIIPPSPSLEQEFSLSYALLCQTVWNHLHASLAQMLNSAQGGPQFCLDLEETDSTFWVSFFTPISYTLSWGLSPSHPVSDRNSTDSFFQGRLGHSLISPKIPMQVTNNLYVLTRAVSTLALLGMQSFKIHCAFSKLVLCTNVYYMCCL